MDPKRDEMAMLRFSLIAPAVNGTYTEPSKAACYRAVSGRLVALPDGGEARFSPGTLAHWEWRYRHEGFEGLVGAARSDSGSTRSLTAQQRAELDAMRRRLPRMSATQARFRMIEEGLMEEGDASVSTFQRYFRNNPVAPAGAPPARDRRAFEAERPNQLWQADTLYGPFAALGVVGGRRWLGVGRRRRPGVRAVLVRAGLRRDSVLALGALAGGERPKRSVHFN